MVSFVVVYAGFAVLAVLMTVAQRRWPASANVPDALSGRAVDWQWWLFSPLVTGSLTRAVTWGVVVVVARAAGSDVDALLAAFASPLQRAPFAVQIIVALVVADVVGYVSHRLRHTRVFWPFHAVHHSPRALDWLAAARMHPIDDVVDNVAVGVAILLCGLDAAVLAFVGPILLLHTMFIHADVAWDFGFVFASPAFHRRHHRRSDHSAGNFAQMFPILDVIGGTYDPGAADAFGVDDDAVPLSSLPAQLAWPFVAMWRRLR